MPGDERIPEILAILGFGPHGDKPGASRSEHQSRRWVGLADEGLLARSRGYTLSLSGDGKSQWLELRGGEIVLRATRTKARLLCLLEEVIDAWAKGGRPQSEAQGCKLRILHGNTPRLEIRHKDWRPLRLTKGQARVLIEFRDVVRAFARE